MLEAGSKLPISRHHCLPIFVPPPVNVYVGRLPHPSVFLLPSPPDLNHAMVASSLLVLAALASSVSAFPAAALDKLNSIARTTTPEDIQNIRRSEEAKRTVSFNAEKQYISTTGKNKFIPPDFAAGDQRGPCPGLNALANHGYLPRNGVAGMNDIIDATGSVYGMGVDLSAFLAVYGTVFDGNPISVSPGYSIGAAPPSGLADNVLGGLGLLGKPQGLT